MVILNDMIYVYNDTVAGVAQSVEQHIRNVWVGGSIPPIGLIKSIGYNIKLSVFLYASHSRHS